MIKTIINAFKVKEIRNKLLLTLLLLFVYRIGCWLPIPGLKVELFQSAVVNESSGFLNLLSSISGGALSNGAFLALGVSPYITASIVMQLLQVVIPGLDRLAREGGEEGRKKMSFYIRICALVLSIGQAVAISIAYAQTAENIDMNILWNGAPTWLAVVFISTILVAGGMLTVWLGERINDLAVGNGMSLLLTVGILSSAGTALLSAVQQIGSDIYYLWNILILLAAVVLIFGLIVLVDESARNVPVKYAKQIQGRRMMGGQEHAIPLKINSVGVIPIIFANALLILPQFILSMFWPDALTWYSTYLGTGSWAYIVLSSALIFAFSFFYSSITFNPDDISKTIQQRGGFIPGFRPGKPTADYLRTINKRLVIFGSLYLSFILLIPSLVFNAISSGNSSLVSAFSATGLMILVSTALETNKQIEAQMFMRTYRGFLK